MNFKNIIEEIPKLADVDIVSLLSRVETAKRGHWRHAGMCSSRIRVSALGERVVGVAVTLALPADNSTIMHYAINFLRKNDFLVVDCLGDRQRACWGGVISSVVQATGAVGAVVDCPITDLPEILARGFPIWSQGVSAKTTRICDLGGKMNVPVSIGGAVVCPGDYILSDESAGCGASRKKAVTEAQKALDIQEGVAEMEDLLCERKICFQEWRGANKLMGKSTEK